MARLPEAEPSQDALDHGRVLDEGDDAHLRAALGALERIDLVDLADELRLSRENGARSM